MRKINLLYIITKLELGGAQKQLLSLIRHLDRDRFNILLFTAQEGLLVEEASAIPSLTLKKSRCLERAINPFKDFLALLEIIIFVKKNKIDIIHTHSSKAGILGRLAAGFAKVKVVLHTVHGWSFNDCQPPAIRAFFIWLERLTAAFTDKLIVVSECDKARGLQNRIGRENKYVLIRYGIDYREFATQDQIIKKELGIPPHEAIVTMVSCLKPQKSPRDFVKLAAIINKEIPNVKFILVGDGILRKGIEALIEKSGLQEKVVLLGWRRDIPRILSATDILVLTSLWEGLPIVVLEAMASCKPVIVTDTGAVAEVVKEKETGFIVSLRDITGMSRRAIVLLKDKNLREAIGRKARQSLNSSFSLEGMIKSTQNLYEDLLTPGPADVN